MGLELVPEKLFKKEIFFLLHFVEEIKKKKKDWLLEWAVGYRVVDLTEMRASGLL